MKFPFQTLLIVVCGVAVVTALLVFAGVIPVPSRSGQAEISGAVTIWGTFPSESVQAYIDQVALSNQDISISYVQKSEQTFENEFINALANDTQPDMIIASQDVLFSVRDKLYTIPYATYNERTFRDLFVDGASLFLITEGVMAVPLVVDPLVVYYNKDILAGQQYITPPITWQDMVAGMARFVRRDNRGVLLQTAIALGEADNVNNFKDILSTLFLQTGNPIISKVPQIDQYRSVIEQSPEVDTDITATGSALRFYTNFANPTSPLYTWVRSLPSAQETFLSGRSAFYIGRASELFILQSRNPNLSFDISEMFQSSGATRPVTYGQFIGIALVKKTKNFSASYSVLGTFSTKEFSDFFSKATNLPPVRRDLLAVQQQNPYVQILFRSALNTFSWPDTNTSASTAAFRAMIQAVNSGQTNPTQAVYEASRDLQSTLR